MLQRTRVMQRNVRMVLILVDSQSSVADLCLKTGNPQLTESALLELEQGGFIEPRVGTCPMWAEGTKVAQEVRAAAIVQRKDLSARTLSAPKALAEQSAPQAAVSVASVVNLPSPVDDSAMPLALAQSGQATFRAGAETETGSVASAQSSHSKAAASFFERVQAYFTKVRFSVGKAGESVFVEGSDEFLASKDRRAAQSRNRSSESHQISIPGTGAQTGEAILRQPIRRFLAESVGWPTVIVLATASALCVVVLTVLFFPSNNYLPEFEAAISNVCGRPAKVGALRLDVYPQPSIVLGDVRVGAGKDEIRIDEIRLRPTIGTLMAARMTFREVMVSGVSLPVEAVAGLPSIFATLSSPSSRFGVDRFGLEKAAITFSALAFASMDGEAKLSADGLFQSLSLRSADRSLRLVATPLARGLEVVLEGEGWRPVSSSAFLFDSVNLNAFVDNGVLTVKDMALRIFDGVIEGKAVLRANQALDVVGELFFRRINAARLSEAIGFGPQFSGETSGKMRFSTKGDAWESIFSTVSAEGDFVMQRGSIRGIDLTEAARNASRIPVQGGATPFENLSGAIKLTPAGYQFSGLVLNSGLMQSTGALNVSSELMVSGTMELRIRGSANQTRIPISISGPLKSPTVAAGRGGAL